MGKKLLMIGLALVALIGLTLFVMLPAIDREMMKDPMVKSISALRTGNVQGLRDCFTRDAVIPLPPDVKVNAAITMFEEEIASRAFRGSMRFGGYQRIEEIAPGVAAADFTIKMMIETNGEDAPYRNIPKTLRGRAELKRTGFLSWKITRVSSDDPIFTGYVRSAVTEGTLPVPGDEGQ